LNPPVIVVDKKMNMIATVLKTPFRKHSFWQEQYEHNFSNIFMGTIPDED